MKRKVAFVLALVVASVAARPLAARAEEVGREAEGPPEAEPPTGASSNRAPRVLLASGLGILGGWAGLVGVLGAFVLGVGPLSSELDEWEGLVVSSGAAVGALGMAGGVALAGELTGGRGDFGGALLGTAVGAAIAAPFWLTQVGGQNEVSTEAEVVNMVAISALSVAGAVVFYEWLGDAQAAPEREVPVVAPFVVPAPRGGRVGLAARF